MDLLRDILLMENVPGRMEKDNMLEKDFLFALFWAWGWFALGFNAAMYLEKKLGEKSNAVESHISD